MQFQTNQLTLDHKREVVQRVIDQKSRQYAAFEKAQKEKLESSNRSTADKNDLVESPREQMMDEIQMRSNVLDQMRTDLDILHTLPMESSHSEIGMGTLVRTNRGDFLVAVADSPSRAESNLPTGVSTESPIFKAMEGKTIGDQFDLRDRTYEIEDLV